MRTPESGIPRDHFVSVRVTKKLLDKMNASRGHVSISRWVRLAIAEKIARDTQ